jgi:hypothetical protein
MRGRKRRTTVAALVVCAGLAAGATSAQAHGGHHGGGGTCPLGNGSGQIKHVIYLQFDNTHFKRDRPDVPSDLEQMPHLLGFLQGQGTLFTNDHTILISHTAGGILASLTGLYPDRNGQTVTNSYDYFLPSGAPTFTSSFKYWTDVVDPTNDPLPNMVTDGQKTTPAPWVPYTRAGCDFGGVGTANIELENNSTAASGDMTRVFGAGSPEWNEANDPATRNKALTDFVGIAIHCGRTGGVCAGDADAKSDPLPDEPGGYDGFQALYGAKYVDPAIAGGPCVNDTAGAPIRDSAGNCGFPGFDSMLAKNTLGYVAQMQEAGVPVTYAYLSDAHDNHALARASGPGEADYRDQLKAYDDAFGAFFARLRRDGITRRNSLFVVTVDEGDHFVGGPGTPQPDGSLAYSHTPCAVLTACPSNQIGEVNVNVKGLLPADEPAFDIHFDDAPTFYVNGQPDRSDPTVRKLERDVGALTATDPYVNGGTTVPLTERLADPVEEKALHMVNADPLRTPTFTMFANADFFFQTTNPSCGGNPCVNPAFAWNHGDYQQEIATTWLGVVGPGVRSGGIDSRTWTDHTNVRPTILALLGLNDDYLHDGRVLVEGLERRATPRALGSHLGTVERLGQAYEQLNASFGAFALDTLQASTTGLTSTDDAKYERIEGRIADLTQERDALAGQIKSQLDGAAFAGRPVDERRARAETLHAWAVILRANALAAER